MPDEVHNNSFSLLQNFIELIVGMRGYAREHKSDVKDCAVCRRHTFLAFGGVARCVTNR